LCSFTYVGNDALSHFASRSILSMTSSFVGRSQSNIYLDDPDFYHQHQNVHNLPSQYSASTMNMPSMIAAATSNPTSSSSSSSSMLKTSTSMHQLKDAPRKITNRTTNLTEQQNMIMDQDQPQQQSALSIPDIYEQQLMNERLMCIQQMMASGQNFASMFNDDPHFVQQIMSYMPSVGHYHHQQEPEVIEIMDE
jgi:hypothetical protein